MCQYNCMSRWQTHVSLSIKHILCNIQYIYIQYTIYNIYTQYIYMYIHQYLLQFTSICPWACEYMCPSVFHNFVRKKKWVHRFARYKKSRPLDMSRCTWLDLTCFYPWARNGKNHPQMVDQWHWVNPLPAIGSYATRQEDDIGTCGPWAKWILDSQKDGQNGGWIDGLMVA